MRDFRLSMLRSSVFILLFYYGMLKSDPYPEQLSALLAFIYTWLIDPMLRWAVGYKE